MTLRPLAAGPREPQQRIRPPLLPLWAALPAAAVAGILMDVAYPDVGWWPAAFVATGVLLIAAVGRSVMGSLAVGLVFGIVFFSLVVSWTSRYLGPLPWAALTIVEGVLTAVWLIPLTLAYRWLSQLIRSDGARLILLPVVVASLWTGREVMLGAWPYGGFPWARLGMTQSEAPAASLASWVGVSGLSFAMVFAVAVFIEWVRTRAWRFPARYVAPLLTVGVLILTPAFSTTPAGTMRLGAVQGNGPSGYFDERAPGAIASAQSRASAALRGADLDLVVWPEGLDADPFQDGYLASNLTQISTQLGAPVLANAATSSGNKLFNTSFLWDPSISPAPTREQVQTHAKRNPVPFGEYVPDRAFYAMLAPDLVGLIQREYSPGTDSPVVSVAGITVGLAICFDVIYDNVIAESITSGAEVLVFQTNNADFRGTDENLQQLAFARMRAIETGRAVVNVSTVGTSQIIRPDGSTQASLNAGEAGVLVEQVELRTGATPGIIVGTSVSIGAAWGGLAVLMIAGWIAHRRARLRGEMSPA